MRRKFIVGNWKMNGNHASLVEAQDIAAAARARPDIDVAVCPPFTMIATMASAGGVTIGGQDCHAASSGAFTGSVSASLLADAGARLAIVGHSERRELSGESDALIAAKASAVLAGGLDVILCIGETLEIRRGGDATAFVLSQLAASLPEGLRPQPGRIAVAYEPVWAIGTGLTPELADIEAMHGAIRGALGPAGPEVRLLYGGSVNAANAAAILKAADVDGALVGGASLTAAAFVPIIAAA